MVDIKEVLAYNNLYTSTFNNIVRAYNIFVIGVFLNLAKMMGNAPYTNSVTTREIIRTIKNSAGLS